MTRAAELRAQADRKRRMAALARRASPGLSLAHDRLLMQRPPDRPPGTLEAEQT